jgi:hypothetical protein
MSVDCTDLLTATVKAIANLGAPSSAPQILPQMQALCPAAGIDLTIAQATLTAGVGRGVLLVCVNPGDATLLYEVNLNMRTLHAGNDKYYFIVNPSATFTAACPTV